LGLSTHSTAQRQSAVANPVFNDPLQADVRPDLRLYAPPKANPSKKSVTGLATSVVCGLLTFWLMAALYVQSHIGLADNGDFIRIQSVLTSGPVKTASKYPIHTKYWIPYWQLDFPRNGKIIQPASNTSTLFLWLPGVLWNYLFYSPNVLQADSLSLCPRILLVFVLLSAFWRIRKDEELTPVEKLSLCIAMGLSYVLLATAMDYTAYLNSFYFETGSLIYLLLFFTMFLHAAQRASRRQRAPIHWCAASLLLLSSAKVSNIYWPLLAVPFLMVLFCERQRPRRRIVLGAVLTIALTAGAFWFVHPSKETNDQNNFNRLFNGALAFSANPGERLTELEMSDCATCIGKSTFRASVAERSLIKAHGKSLLNCFACVLCREPAVPFRMMKYAADNMQTISIDYLGKYSFGVSNVKPGKLANLWSALKARCFPKGYALFATLAAFLAIFYAGAKTLGLRRELSLAGLMATIACFIDMNVAVFGDGRHEIVKHLFLANVLFDVAAIAALNVAILSIAAWAKSRWGNRTISSAPHFLPFPFGEERSAGNAA
jgi:hypothetical protein